MKLANKAYVVALLLLTLAISMSAQTKRSAKDPRNQAPTVGTGGTMGGPTGLFTVYDGSTIRKGEYTFSAAYSNYDRDPGNADIADIPLSFQVGLSDHVELFFNTTAYRGIKINSPRNLSSFYLPNSKVFIGGGFTSGPAIVLAPRGPGAALYTGAVFRPTGTQPFVPFNYVGGQIGTLGLIPPFFSGPLFGYAPGTNALLSAAVSGGNGADNFPGIGSVYGSVLPGIVLATQPLLNVAGAPTTGNAPAVFTLAPTYLPDAPFVNRSYGESAFNDFTVGGKWRWTGPNNPIGVGLVGYYRWYADLATGLGGMNQMQRGAGPGGNRGDFGLALFADARLRKWVNVSGNVAYHYNSTVKGDMGGQTYKLLDRPDELMFAIGVDFPVNRYFQPIAEFRALKYVGGRTPNAFENNPMDAILGFRYHPARWFGFGAAYRWHANEQDKESFDNEATFTNSSVITCNPPRAGCTSVVINNTYTGVPPGFQLSENPHGYIVQAWIGRRNDRNEEVANVPANVTALDVDDTIVLPCPPGTTSTNQCNDSTNLTVRATAVDQENDPMVFKYVVSGGRVVGETNTAQWDVSGLRPGQYTITASVNDGGCGFCGQTQTRTITIKECEGCTIPCDCTNVNSVTGPSGVTQPGDTMTFTANTSGNVDVTYNWTVSAGTIESGQGTSSIVVRTTSDMANQSVTATVTLGGNREGCNCVNSDSETGVVADVVKPRLTDEFGDLKPDDLKARIDNYYIELQNNPDARGVIVNYGTPAQVRKRKADIIKAINFLKKDLGRVTFVDGPNTGEGVKTKLWIVPPGASEPEI